MRSFLKHERKFIRSETGQGLVEYSLILLLCIIVSIVIVTNIGTPIVQMFVQMANSL